MTKEEDRKVEHGYCTSHEVKCRFYTTHKKLFCTAHYSYDMYSGSAQRYCFDV